MPKFGRYTKAITALVGGWITWGYIVISSKPAPITSAEWMALVVATATALGVYGATNAP